MDIVKRGFEPLHQDDPYRALRSHKFERRKIPGVYNEDLSASLNFWMSFVPEDVALRLQPIFDKHRQPSLLIDSLIDELELLIDDLRKGKPLTTNFARAVVKVGEHNPIQPTSIKDLRILLDKLVEFRDVFIDFK